MPLTVNDDIVYCKITVLLGLTDVSKEEQNAQYITDSSPEYKRFGSGSQTTRDATPELPGNETRSDDRPDVNETARSWPCLRLRSR